MADPFTLELDFRNTRYQDAEKGLVALAAHFGMQWDGIAKVMSM